MTSSVAVTDRLFRPLKDLRISVTDRCNFRCVYCMPKEVFDKDYRFLPRAQLLTFEEIERVVRAAADLGVTKIRLTGGEPLVRRDLEKLIEQIRQVPGITDISMTTNASLLDFERARSLRDAGLQRLTISLDAMDDDTFKRVNDVDIGVQTCLTELTMHRALASTEPKSTWSSRKDSMITPSFPWRGFSTALATFCVLSSSWMSATATHGIYRM